jgi:UDP-2,4-diacetamido-2,4,6-trideoxy-beta-L-altropyranose hydrolase
MVTDPARCAAAALAVRSALLVRADAGPEMGTGHVMRCLALAQAWQDAGGWAAFALATPAAEVQTRLRREEVEVLHLAVPPGSPEDAAATADAARRQQAAWVVLDGYHFGAGYQRAIKDAGKNLMVLDDYGHAEHYWADLVLNQDLNAEERLYRNREPSTRLLLGLQYVLLRREFRRWRWQRPDIAGLATKLLVTMGGADPDNVTVKVIRALEQIARGDLETVVLVGPTNPHWAELEAEAGQGRANLRLVRNATNIPELMAWCDMAVTAGGSTLWELALMAVPSLVLILADNQEPSARLLDAQGACRVLGRWDEVSAPALAAAVAALLRSARDRAALGQCFRALVDGRGADRVCRILAGEGGDDNLVAGTLPHATPLGS